MLPAVTWAQPWTTQFTISSDVGSESYSFSGDKIGWEAVDYDASINGDVRVLYGDGPTDTCIGAGRIWLSQGFLINDDLSVGMEAWFEPTGSGWEIPARQDRTVTYIAEDGSSYVDREGQITINDWVCHGDSASILVSYRGATELKEGNGPAIVNVQVTAQMTVPVVPD